MALPFLTGTQAVENCLKPDLDRNKESRKTIGDFYLLNICTNSTFCYRLCLFQCGRLWVQAQIGSNQIL